MSRANATASPVKTPVHLPECGGECDAAELIALYDDIRAGHVSDAEVVGLWIEKLDARGSHDHHILLHRNREFALRRNGQTLFQFTRSRDVVPQGDTGGLELRAAEWDDGELVPTRPITNCQFIDEDGGIDAVLERLEAAA